MIELKTQNLPRASGIEFKRLLYAPTDEILVFDLHPINWSTWRVEFSQMTFPGGNVTGEVIPQYIELQGADTKDDFFISD